MKSLVVSALCIALVVSAWLFFSGHSDRLIDDLVSLTETDVYTAVREEDWPAADQSIAALSGLWEKHRPEYLIFSDHDLLFDIDVTFGRLKAYADAMSRDQTMGELLALKSLLLLLRQSESLNWGNLI